MNDKPGRFVVEDGHGQIVKARLFGDDPRDGSRVYWEQTNIVQLMSNWTKMDWT